MSKYTMELRYILELGYDFGLNDYPIFDESYRTTLNNSIINTYYFSEICEETVARWAIRFKTKMNIIMPYYNKLYESQKIEIDPLSKLTETKTIKDEANGNNSVEGNETLTGNTTNDRETNFTADDQDSRTTSLNTDIKNRNITSDTPQAILSVNDIESNLYASTASFDTNGKTDNGTDELSSTKDHQEKTTDTITIDNSNETSSKSSYQNTIDRSETIERSFVLPQSELLMKYRETFLNIDKMIIEELKPLFMRVF